MANPSCFRLFLHCVRLAASRACCTAGRRRAMSTAMMAITTRSSIRVKPRRRDRISDLLATRKRDDDRRNDRREETIGRRPRDDRATGSAAGAPSAGGLQIEREGVVSVDDLDLVLALAVPGRRHPLFGG